MKEWLAELCGTGFMPHGHCYLWTPSLLWLHAVSDCLIALAYFSIPATLVYFVRQRRDVPYPSIFLMFGAFIVACGMTHVCEVWSIWHSHNYLTGGVKAFTAFISLATAGALVRVMPEALQLTGPAELRRLNEQLEQRVRERTAELEQANTTLRREMAQCEQAERRRQAMFDSALDAIVTIDRHGRVTEMNPAAERIFGHSRAAALQRDMAELIIPPELRERHRQGLARMLTVSPGPSRILGQRVELHALHARGHTFPVELTVTRIQDDPPLFTGFIRDITERKQAEAERLEMERNILETQKLESLGVLAGGIAHDFNNLLTGVLGNATLARIELSESSPHQRHLERIESAARRAADLCRQMLAYSGRGRFVVEPLDLSRLVRDTMPLLNISISKTCVLRLNLAPALPAVEGDATQLQQIIMNLVINASEAIGERSGVIAVSTGVMRADEEYLRTLRFNAGLQPGDFTILEVSDTGCGMDAATLARIFDPFFTTKFTGRGLGLAAVLGIVRGHTGGLKVHSEPGAGSTFRLLLPCSTRPAASPDAPAAAEPTGSASGCVLVVDDEETVRVVAARVLEHLGFEVELADDGRQAIEKFRARPDRYQLVLLDLTMPHLDGEETFRQLRHLRPGVRVLLMSGYNEHEALSRFTGKGLAGFVQKPFEAAGLAAAVRKALLTA